MALALLSSILPLLGCEVGLGAGPAAGRAAAVEAHDDLVSRVELVEIAPSVFVHTSYRDLPNVGLFPSNGLLLCTPGEGGLVDTAWGDAPTHHLLDEAAARGCPVKRAVFTHSHDDRSGGLSALFARGVRVWATAETTRLLARPGFAPEALVAPARLELGKIAIDVFFPGKAHAPDNLVVHVPSRRVLFGGCMVKSSDAKTLGNVKDASLDQWPSALARVSERYASETSIVVPGHGAHGGAELLRHTADLLLGPALPAR